MEIYKDASADIEDRVDDLLSKMTVEEKIGQMLQLPAKQGIVAENYMDKMDDWHIGSFLHCSGSTMQEIQERAAESRLGIPVIFGVDAIHGHCFDEKGTVFPTQLAMSCSWNRNLLREMARVTAREVRASGMHWTFSPVLCLARDTRWGRVDETFGEDPWLTGELGMEMVKGYQGEDLSDEGSILACAKHYVAYGESTGGRDSYETEVSLRNLRSIFLPPFEKAVKRSGVTTLMTSYQAIDGVPVTTSRTLLKDILKSEWGFDGLVITDWNNIGSLTDQQSVTESSRQATLESIRAGNDMSMSTDTFFEDTLNLYKDGLVSEDELDNSVARILRLKFRLGLFDNRRFVSPEKRRQVIGDPNHWRTSLDMSRQSLTLLTNRNVLPLENLAGKSILLTGPNADDVMAQLGDWSFGSMQAGAVDNSFHADDTVTVLDAFHSAADIEGFSLDYVKGADCLDNNYDDIALAVEKAKTSDYVILCVGDTIELHGEGRDRSDLSLTGKQMELFHALRQVSSQLIVLFIASKPLAIPEIKEKSDAVLCCFNPGAKGGIAIAEVLTGKINPSGKLSVSFPYSAGQLPVYYNRYRGWHSFNNQNEEKYIDAPEQALFSFGEGLSYSKFTYSNLKVLTPVIRAGQNPRFSVSVHNTGKRTGTEISQLYINDLISSVTTPNKNLKGFLRSEIQPGEEKTLEFDLEFDELSLILSDCTCVVEPGEFEVMIGSSSKDEDLLKGLFSVVSG